MKVLGWIRASGELTARVIQRKNQRLFRSADDVHRVLNKLEREGLIETDSQSTVDSRRGKRTCRAI